MSSVITIGADRDKRPLKAKIIHLRTIGEFLKKFTKENFLIEAHKKHTEKLI